MVPTTLNTRSFLLTLALISLGACKSGEMSVAEDTASFTEEVEEIEEIDSAEPEAFYPRDCQDIADADPSASDGRFTLYVDGDSSKPWTAMCVDMRDEPMEYLVLPHSGDGSNEAEYPCDGWASGSTVRTVVEAVAINPRTFKVDSHDLSFASSEGSCNTFAQLTELPWGYAGTCNGLANGLANIDLAGTPFVVAADQFAVEGWQASGEADYFDGGQRVELVGGGACGSMSPASPEGVIQLEYRR